MPFIPKERFHHRLCPDNTWDSFCLRCLRTVARKCTDECMLADAETVHECDPVTLLEAGSNQMWPANLD